jgi:hypothetical protein
LVTAVLGLLAALIALAVLRISQSNRELAAP